MVDEKKEILITNTLSNFGRFGGDFDFQLVKRM